MTIGAGVTPPNEEINMFYRFTCNFNIRPYHAKHSINMDTITFDSDTIGEGSQIAQSKLYDWMIKRFGAGEISFQNWIDWGKFNNRGYREVYAGFNTEGWNSKTATEEYVISISMRSETMLDCDKRL